MTPQDFFTALYRDLLAPTGRWRGTIEMRFLGKGDNRDRLFLSSPAQVQEVLDQWGPRQVSEGAGIYYGVALRRVGALRGRKTDIIAIPAVWCDVDTEKMGWDMNRTILACKTSPLRPSAIVNSGHGLHLYWLLAEPVVLEPFDQQLVNRVEDLRRLNEIFGCDPTLDISRILRVPGTINVKKGRRRPVEVVAGDWQPYTLEQLEQLVGEQTTWLENGEWLAAATVKARAKLFKAEKGKTALANKYIRETGLHDRGLTIATLWNHVVYCGGGKQLPRGSAFIGLDEGILRATAMLYASGMDRGDIIEAVLKEVRLIKARDAPHETWDWAAERREIADKLERWIPRWTEIYNEREEQKRRTGTASRTRNRGKEAAPELANEAAAH